MQRCLNPTKRLRDDMWIIVNLVPGFLLTCLVLRHMTKFQDLELKVAALLTLGPCKHRPLFCLVLCQLMSKSKRQHPYPTDKQHILRAKPSYNTQAKGSLGARALAFKTCSSNPEPLRIAGMMQCYRTIGIYAGDSSHGVPILILIRRTPDCGNSRL